MGNIVNHSKDQCETTRIQWKLRGFWCFVAHLTPNLLKFQYMRFVAGGIYSNRWGVYFTCWNDVKGNSYNAFNWFEDIKCTEPIHFWQIQKEIFIDKGPAHVGSPQRTEKLRNLLLEILPLSWQCPTIMRRMGWKLGWRQKPPHEQWLGLGLGNLAPKLCKNLSTRWFQKWPFDFSNVGSHLAIFERVT